MDAMLIIHLNVQGLTSHFVEVKQLLIEKKPLIVCVSETHITPEIHNEEINIPGYNIAICYSNSRHTGGSLIYVKSCLNYEVIDNELLDYNFWAIWIRVRFNKEYLIAGAIYRSPNANCQDFFNYLEEKLNEDRIHHQRTFIMGDLNIDLLKNSADAKKLRQVIQSAGVTQIVTRETRVTNTSSTLIDHIITNDFNATEVPRDFPMLTDHEIIGTRIALEGTEAKKIIYRRNICEESITELNIELTGVNWNYTSTNVNAIYLDFVNIIQTAVDKIAPLQKITPKKYPWITASVRQAQVNRDRAYKKFCLTKNSHDWREYQKFRNKVITCIRTEKTKYYEQNIDRSKGDCRKMWRTLKELVGNKKQSSDFTSIDFGVYARGSSVEENFNNFFSGSQKEITNSIEKRHWDSKTNFSKGHSINGFKCVSISELKSIVFGLKNKSTSEDWFNIKLVKDLFFVIGYPLLYLINTSISTGKVPDELKISTIIPIPKVTKPTTPGEFRPINLLPVVDKIIETIICAQLRAYLEDNDLLFAGQSGFRTNHSCETALQYVCATWRQNLNEDKVILSVFVDLQRAFETIDRDILIKKLFLYGIKEMALAWITDYLCNRYHRTKVERCVSQKIHSKCGVPQGSVLGPLLFIVYVNDVQTILQNSFVNLFADDTLICVAGKDFKEITDVLNDELKILYDWLCKNKLKLNATKTKCMIIGSRANCKKFSESGLELKINNSIVQFVSEIKYLGIILDPQLNFSLYVDYLCKKLGKKIGYCYRISTFLSQWAKICVYNAIILPHFQYCSSLLISCTQENIQKLQIQQNKAMRMILKCNKYTPIKEMLNSLNWLSMEQSVRKANLIIIYKIEHEKLPKYLNTFLERRLNFHNYDIRSRENYNIQTVKTRTLQKSLFFEGVRLYNALPNEIKNSSSLNIFNQRLFSYLKDM